MNEQIGLRSGFVARHFPRRAAHANRDREHGEHVVEPHTMGGDYEEDWELLEKKLEDKTAEKAQNGSARDHDAAADGRGSRGEKRDRDRRDRDDSRDRGRDRGDRRRSDSRDRRRDRDRGRRGRSPRRSRSRSRDRRDRRKMTSEEREAERKRRKEERELERQKAELEKLDRDTRTVFAYNLSTKADERDIYQFFSKAGTVNDVRIIYDRNTPRSKGMAYIEFADKANITDALALTGQMLRNQVVMVKASEAEKNIAWEAEQAQKKLEMKALGATDPASAAAAVNAQAHGTGPCKLQVHGLDVNIGETDLKAVFEPFGETDFISIQRDSTGRSRGVGFVQYKQTQHAVLAISQLNGLELVGQSLKVTMAPIAASTLNAAQAASMVTDKIDEQEGVRLDSRSRAALMAKLAGQDETQGALYSGGIDPKTGLPVSAEEMAAAQRAAHMNEVEFTQGVLGPGSPIPTQCLLLKNMFDPAEETEPEWWIDIGEDVKDECSKHGPVSHIHVDKESRGFVYLKFESTEGASAARQALHGRWFAGKMIAAEFQFVPVYNKHFGI